MQKIKNLSVILLLLGLFCLPTKALYAFEFDLFEDLDPALSQDSVPDLGDSKKKIEKAFNASKKGAEKSQQKEKKNTQKDEKAPVLAVQEFDAPKQKKQEQVKQEKGQEDNLFSGAIMSVVDGMKPQSKDNKKAQTPEKQEDIIPKISFSPREKTKEELAREEQESPTQEEQKDKPDFAQAFPEMKQILGGDTSDMVPKLGDGAKRQKAMPSLGAKKDVGKQKSAGKPRSPVRMPTIGDDVGNKRNFSSSDPRQAQTSYGTNAAVFDVAGIMLRMSVKQVKGAAKARGFVLTQEKKQIPNFVKWKYEAKCRAKGVVGFEALAACVLRRAVKQNKQYVSKLVFNKYETKETLEVYFTSTFTGNRVHKVDYRCMDDLSRGNTQKDRYLRMIWIQNFWRRIASKYGPPDDENRVRWGLGENKPFLMAATGRLLLVDPHLPEIDYSKMSRADRNTVNTDLFNF